MNSSPVPVGFFSIHRFITALPSAAHRFFLEYRFPILAALSLRLASSLWLALAWVFMDPYFPTTEKAVQETYNNLPVHQSLLGRALVDVWLRWDAVHYMNLAWGGYENAGAADMNFWPLYPYLVRLIQSVLRDETVLTGLIVSTAAAIAAAVYLWKLARYLFNDRALANWTVLLWVIYPTSFFLVAPYTDGLFAALAAAALWNISQRKWIAAGILGALAGLTRSQGILLIVPYLMVLVQDRFSLSRQKILPAMIGLSCLPLGTIGFIIWRWTRGAPDFVASYSVYSKALILDPVSSIFLALKRFISSPDLLSFTEIFSVLAFLAMIIWMFTQPHFRKHAYFLIYGLLTVIFILIKHNLAATPLQSSNRYVLNALPAFVGYAFLIKNAHPRLRSSAAILSICIAMVAAVLYAMWIFVGYRKIISTAESLVPK